MLHDHPEAIAFVSELYQISNELNLLVRRLNVLLRPSHDDPTDEQPATHLLSDLLHADLSDSQHQPTPPPTDLFIGDRVVILSNYKKLRGATGTIGGFRGTTQVLIALDNSDQVIVRALRSVQLRSNRRSHY